MIKPLALLLQVITDPQMRENFKRIGDFLTGHPILKANFEQFTISVPTPGALVNNFRFPHNLGYTPRDILVTSAIGSGTVTWNYDKFSSTELDLSITGAAAGGTVVLRVFVGNFT